MLGAQSPTSWFNRPQYYDPGPQGPNRPTTKVFVSYSHKDSAVADALCRRLAAEGLNIVIDSGALGPGKSIQEFIQEGVRSTDATVSIVSKYSLLSAWVAMESEETLGHQRKSFFGCYLDEEFLRRGFVDEAIDHADLQIREIGENIKRRIDRNSSFDDLYADLQRYRTLRSSIDKIVARLKATRCLSLRQDVFDESVKTLVQALKELKAR
jgi:hypothetical protein